MTDNLIALSVFPFIMLAGVILIRLTIFKTMTTNLKNWDEANELAHRNTLDTYEKYTLTYIDGWTCEKCGRPNHKQSVACNACGAYILRYDQSRLTKAY
jgi:hypothetical protein